jgi:hypothetical protein
MMNICTSESMIGMSAMHNVALVTTMWDESEWKWDRNGDSNASSMMCTADTKTNTKLMQGGQGNVLKGLNTKCGESQKKLTQADEAYNSNTKARHSVPSAQIRNSCRQKDIL